MNPFTNGSSDKSAMRPFVKILWPRVIIMNKYYYGTIQSKHFGSSQQQMKMQSKVSRGLMGLVDIIIMIGWKAMSSAVSWRRRAMAMRWCQAADSSNFQTRAAATLKLHSHCGRLRHVTAVTCCRRHVTAIDGRSVQSTAVDRDRMCANAGDGLKNLTLKACYDRRRRAQC